jgi:hypothetical protein
VASRAETSGTSAIIDNLDADLLTEQVSGEEVLDKCDGAFEAELLTTTSKL